MSPSRSTPTPRVNPPPSVASPSRSMPLTASPSPFLARSTGDTRSRKRAAPEGIVRFEEQVDAEITVARLPAGEDPDEFVRRDPRAGSAPSRRPTR